MKNTINMGAEVRGIFCAIHFVTVSVLFLCRLGVGFTYNFP